MSALVAATALRTQVRVEQIMGMPISCHVRAAGDGAGPDEVEVALDNVMAHLRQVDRLFSTWRPDSALLRWRRGELADDDRHPWLPEVERLCEEARELTDGLFDAGFGGAYDPTGLVKGWAVQRAADYLALLPGVSYALGAGGDLQVGAGPGVDPEGSVWRIGVEDPRRPGQVARRVVLGRGAVATSGCAARGAHVVDPRDGRPVGRSGSTTVAGPELLWADVWATAAWVDPDQTRRLMTTRAPAYQLLEL